MKFRKLELGEVLKKGDEVAWNGGWDAIVDPAIGSEVWIRDTFRRPTPTPEQSANLFRERLAGLMEEFGVSEISIEDIPDIRPYAIPGQTIVAIIHDSGLEIDLGNYICRESLTRPETGDKEMEG